MKSKLIIGVGVIIVVLLAIFLLSLKNTDSTSSSNLPSEEELSESEPNTENQIPAPNDPSQNTPVADNYEIEIVNFNFSQLALTITKGSTVTWTNKDSARHTVTSDSGSELNSELFGKDETYSHTFNELGTFDYHCAPHPFMKAKIVVE